jgi:S-adenosylmethionine:tRNA ribosyltransferase-isomerase
MTDLENTLALYDYPLAPEMIATTPASPRDSSKLLVYDRSLDNVTITTFNKLPDFLPKDTLLVFNDTKVIPARIRGTTKTGGKAEILCTSSNGNNFTGLCERRLETGETVHFGSKHFATVLSKTGSEYSFELHGTASLREIQQAIGTTPLPPYLKHSPLSESERRSKYQTVFAKRDGSIAAPTASLHFTKRLLKKLQARGVASAYITLHVNLGTFMPLTEESMQTGLLHEEYFDIPTATRRTIETTKQEGGSVIPVGTTALRALESMSSSATSTRLFIREGYEFKVANGLITNFHVPRSSLMMLVAALVGREKLLELYAIAQKNDFRFFSFGDAMLIKEISQKPAPCCVYHTLVR